MHRQFSCIAVAGRLLQEQTIPCRNLFKQLSEAERWMLVKAIFLTYGCMDQASASLIAELLGFQPSLVLPQLEKHIEDSKKTSGQMTEQPA